MQYVMTRHRARDAGCDTHCYFKSLNPLLRSDEGLRDVVQQALEEAGQGERGELRLQDFEAALRGADLSDMHASRSRELHSEQVEGGDVPVYHTCPALIAA